MELVIKQALERAVAAHQEGKLQEAESIYRSVLQNRPEHPTANHNLGLIAVSVNQMEASIPLFETALASNPTVEQYWMSYVDALVKVKRPKDARSAIKKAKKKGIDAKKLTKLLKSQKAVVDDKKPPQEQLNLLIKCFQSGNHFDVERMARNIIEEFPKHHFAWKALGTALGATGRQSDAAEAYQTAITLNPDDVETHYNLGITLQRLDKLSEAEASYKQAVTLKPSYSQAHNNLGVTLQALGRFDDAEACYERVIALEPKHVEAHNNLGVVLQILGKFNEAKVCFETAIALRPTYAEAHRNLTTTKRYTSKDEQYSKMLEVYLDKTISTEQRCHINFGLAKASEDLEEFEDAFTHLGEGNELRKKLLNYDINQDVELFGQIKSNFSKIEQISLVPEKLSKSVTPIFIVGMPRSGTTLVEQIISSHLHVTGAGELPYVERFGSALASNSSSVNEQTLLDFRNDYLEKLNVSSDGNSIVTDKVPQNFRYLGLLAIALPEAKFVHVKRNPCAVCWANFKTYFNSLGLGYSYALDDIVKYHNLYEDLMAFWSKKLVNKIYDLDYELLTDSPEKETPQLIQYLDLDWDERCLSPEANKRAVATASSQQVRRKIYRGSSDQWKNYEPFLNGVFDNLHSSTTERH